MKHSHLLLIVLAHISSCASDFCSFSATDEFEPHRLSIGVSFVQDIAPLAVDDLLVVSRPDAGTLALDLTRAGPTGEEKIASLPALFPSDLRQSVFAGERGWWFSRQGEQGSIPSVFFVVGGEVIQKTQVKLPRRSNLVWLPIRGEAPRGLQVSVVDEQPALHIDEVTPSGVKPLGAFLFRETGVRVAVISSRWSAEELTDGRYALVAVDGPPGDLTLKLRILGGDDLPESDLPCPDPIDFPVATAVDASGRLAIVGLSKGREVVAMILDADQPQSALCRVISASGELAARPPFGSPAVISTGEDFIAAWIRDDGTVRASELGSLAVAPSIVDVGEGAEGEYPLRQLIHADAEHVIFLWKDRDGGFLTRRLPKRLTEYTVATALMRFLCAAFDES